MVKLLLETYDKMTFVPARILDVLGRDVLMQILGMDLNDFIKTKSPDKSPRSTDRPVMEH